MAWTHQSSFTVPAPADRLYAAFADERALTAWFAEHAEVGAAVGAPYRFWGRQTLAARDAPAATQRVTELVPDESLGFSWPMFGVDTQVRLTFTPADGGTTLAVTHTVRGDLGVPRQHELIDDWWRLVFGNVASWLGDRAGMCRADVDDPSPEVRHTVLLHAPVDAVWRALIEPARVSRWLSAPAVEIEPRAGGRYVLGWRYTVDGRDVVGGPTQVLEVAPHERLVLDWPDWRGDPAVPVQTIAFRLEPVGGDTRLTFVHAGFGRTTDVGDYAYGWLGFLGMLRAEVEGSP